ncbi:AAA domain-containing protein [Niabella sp.]|uniref:DEAD/DEAH box helicase n=1 Tax=Niabella sp. TaxID=1962976 RepID=UPI00261C972A|nr:AAA domain-containing protein [Niabella sp.]
MDWEEPVSGDTCLSALLLDQSGQPDHKSYIPAAFVFGIHCIKEAVSIATLPEKLTEAQSAFELRYNIPLPADEQPERRGSAVTWKFLQHEIDYLDRITKGWNKTPIEVYCIAQEVPKDAEPDINFLNSFYLSDLNLLIAKGEHYGTALRRYLSVTASQEHREDLVANRALLCKTVDPELMPMGRWPASIGHGLYTAQAGAVNSAISGLKDKSGIMGINGPPGTGKTTLLLDIIADVVVTRALELMRIGPDALFSRFSKIEKEEGFSGYFGLKSNIAYNSGVVVASNNNAAVENITKTLPSTGKIDYNEFKDAAYFTASAQRLIEGESWGLLSAALGNAQNRSNFKWKFWLSDAEKGITGFQDMLWDLYRNPDNDQTDMHRQQFNDVKKELKRLTDEFNTFKKEAGYLHKQFPVIRDNKLQKDKCADDLYKLEAAFTSLCNEEHRYKQQLSETDDLIDLTKNMLAHIKQQRPSFLFFHKLFNTSAYKKWSLDYSHSMDQLREHIDKKTLLTKQLNRLCSELNSNRAAAANSKDTLAKITKTIGQYFKRIKELQTQYKIECCNIVDEAFYNEPLENIQLRTPYASETINRLRSRIFLKSLELHQHCILANAKQIRNNLSLFFEMIEGRAIVQTSIAQTLWGTLFLCVPVISTTLASVSRLFACMGKESIGWLLLDEAGQATPQSAAGMIWRSKRCIIVGDPLQIEPVVTIPPKLIFKLRQQADVAPVWSPTNSSAQILADRVSEKGTYMLTGESDEHIWTGFPLRTHRRCDNPMFDIANNIAYSGQMVKATADLAADSYIGPSAWFHVTAVHTPVNKHVLTEELDLLKEKISALKESGYTNELFVISPFKSVANACASACKQMAGVHCGTIHRFQGKEADIVFLVLGGNPASQGARDWASQKPNMLNVALTRARKRFYVIGNKTLWGRCRHFDVMAARLPGIVESNT